MPRRFRLVTVLALSLLTVASACGSDTASPTAAAPTSVASRATGSVTVFAAASLTESFNDLQTALKTSDPALTVTYSFGSSGALVTQIQQGAPADVVATADTDTMKKLRDASLIEAPVTFAKNRLDILVAPRNPKGVKALSDLSRSDLKVVLGDDAVPVGKYGAQALAAAGVTVKPVSKEVDVKAAVAKVTSGEADASIVYVTDVNAAGSKGQGVDIPDAQNVIAQYPIAVVTAAKNHAAAAAFVDSVVKGAGQTALHQRGFLPAA
ncbi:MAG: molybdate ABC transporter substrate-binding protein [Actinomycetota bacterium]|nr:molybdate ABC transporter substrate-binding protein [Actinomycetota bacterium]